MTVINILNHKNAQVGFFVQKSQPFFERNRYSRAETAVEPSVCYCCIGLKNALFVIAIVYLKQLKLKLTFICNIT